MSLIKKLSLAILAVTAMIQAPKHFNYENINGNHVIITDLFENSSFTPGPFIVFGNKNLRLEEEGRDMYLHECGHVEQFRDLGKDYYVTVAVPSMINYYFFKDINFYTETWANKLAEERYGEFKDNKRFPTK